MNMTACHAVAARSSMFRGHGGSHGGGRAKCCAVRGGVQQKQIGGCYSTTFHFSLFLFGFFVLSRPTRAAPAERERTGATPTFSPLARLGVGGEGVAPGATPSPLAKRGRSRPKSSMLEGSDTRQRARADAPTSGAMTRRVGGFLLTVGETCWWHWAGMFPVDEPVDAAATVDAQTRPPLLGPSADGGSTATTGSVLFL